ncbi:MAG: DUF262 domain-containing protein [Rhizobiaceae bacterium]
MAGATFKTNPFSLYDLLRDCRSGELQLPDFQRSWVWDEDRIKSLIASVSRAFPVGALMTLETGGNVDFKPRPVEGAPDAARQAKPQSLLLDGQQRITSLYQVTLRGEVVQTVTPRKKRVKRWFYIDIRKALDPSVDSEDAIVALPENRILTKDFGREVIYDASDDNQAFASLLFPMTKVFDWDRWQDGYDDYWRERGDQEPRDTFREFKREVLENFKAYQIPVIALGKDTSKEAVCLVFEKVNTGGKPLDAFELVTAMYAAEGHELRKDWYGTDGNPGRHQRFVEALRPADSDRGIIAEVANTDFLQTISLFHTRQRRNEAVADGRDERDLPQITASRQALLNLPLAAYKLYEAQVEQGFVLAARFLHRLNIFRIFDLPYQSQVVPLAAILAEIGNEWQHDAVHRKLVKWYWSGVFGELYGSAVESRIAKDFSEVPAWLRSDEHVPATVGDASFRAERLETMRMRLSAAYKGVNALLMKEGAVDFRSGQKFSDTVFFGENVDIHHIFPQDWCKRQGLHYKVYDSIINKTPLTFRTNRIIGGSAPSEYMARLEAGTEQTPPIPRDRLDEFLRTHLIDPDLLRADDFEGFTRDRQGKLLTLIEEAMGKQSYRGDAAEEGIDAEQDEDETEAELTMAAAE